MCGITGFIDYTKKSNKEILQNMTDVLIHRGPDDSGYFFKEYPNYQIGLGHRRLSILDLSIAGHQPMKFEYLTIIYNGEVYNFRKIRRELISYGYKFDSDTDTEVILKSFHKWGKDAVGKFRGMWAFAIWDEEKEELLLSRDRIGIKPLYWYYKNGLFMFSSELKSFHKHPKFRKELSYEGLSLYLQHGYITAPHTIFEDTNKLLPGHFLILNKKGNINIEKYWDIKNYFISGIKEKEKWLKRTEEDVIEELEEILTESFKLRMVSDVPIGMFLSGGIDSSLVTALLQKEYSTPLKTFTIGFYEEKYNEADWAKKVATYLGTDHTELYCTPQDAFNIIPKLPELYDEPFGDSSAIPTFLVSQLARTKVKVSLSADGGDEQFFGYNRYWLTLERIKKFKKIRIFSPFIRFFDPIVEGSYNFYKIRNLKNKFLKLNEILKTDNFLQIYDILISHFVRGEIKKLGIIKGNISNLEKIDGVNFLIESKMMYYDLLAYLPDDILVKVDRATMGVSLEGRDPFLDNKILEYSSQLPTEFKYKNGQTKYILKKILYKHVPQDLVDRPKQGFGVPIHEWFRKELKNLYIEYLGKEKMTRDRIFNPEFVQRLLQEYLDGDPYNHTKLWYLFVFQLWSERWKPSV